MNSAVGRDVYLKPIGDNARRSTDILEHKIKKVGRKYFYTWDGENEHTTRQFDFEDLKEVTKYSPGWQVYFFRQELLDEEEYVQIIGEIRKTIGTWGTCDLNLEQLRKIRDVIKGKEAPNEQGD